MSDEEVFEAYSLGYNEGHARGFDAAERRNREEITGLETNIKWLLRELKMVEIK